MIAKLQVEKIRLWYMFYVFPLFISNDFFNFFASETAHLAYNKSRTKIKF